MVQYVIGLAAREYVRAAASQGVCLFGGGHKGLVEDLSVGDEVIFASPTVEQNGDPLECFTALGKITGHEVRLKTHWPDHPGFKAHVLECTYADVRSVPFASVAAEHLPWDDLQTDAAPRFDVDRTAFNAIAAAMGVR